MKDLKVPLVTASIFFILIFIINIFKNTLFVTVSRSIFTGAFVFFIIFGIIYLFKNIIKIDAEGAESYGSEPENEEPSVDITLDEETNPVDNINYNKGNIIADADENAAEIYNTPDTENYDNVSAEDLSLDADHLEEIEKLDKEPGEEFVKAESKKIDSGKPENLEGRESKEDKVSKEDNDIMDTEDYNMEEIVKNTEEEDLKNPEDEDFEYYPKDDDIKDTKKPLKDRFGFDVSYEDLVKAVRTEMKKDKE